MKRFSFYWLIALMPLLTSCFSSKPVTSSTIQTGNISLALISNPQANKYINLDYGIRLNVKDGRANTQVLQKYDASATQKPYVTVQPEVTSFVSESTRRYMRTMGFNLDADVATDYMLNLTIKEFNINYLSGTGWTATVSLNVEVYDHNRKLVYPSITAVGRANASSINVYPTYNQPMGKSLSDIESSLCNRVGRYRLGSYCLFLRQSLIAQTGSQQTGNRRWQYLTRIVGSTLVYRFYAQRR